MTFRRPSLHDVALGVALAAVIACNETSDLDVGECMVPGSSSCDPSITGNAREGESCVPYGYACSIAETRRCGGNDWAGWLACCGVWVAGRGNDRSPPRSCDDVKGARCPNLGGRGLPLPGLCDVDASVDADGSADASVDADGSVDAEIDVSSD